MNIIPKDGPAVVQPANAKSDPRSRAIEKFMNPPPGQAQAQEHPVSNPSQVSPEEMSAIKAPDAKTEDFSQNDKVVESSSEAPAEVSEPAKEEAPLSQQYAVLARKEKALRAKIQAQDSALKAREAALLAREDALKAKETDYTTNYVPKQRLTESPWEVLSEAGVSYDQVTQQALNHQQESPAVRAALARMEAEIRAAKEAQVQAQKSLEAQQTQNYQSALKQIEADTTSLVNSDPQFETIKETGSVPDVVQLIEKTFKEDGILMSIEDAAKEIEEYLVDQAVKIARLKKIQGRLAPQPPTKAEVTKQVEQTKQQQPQMKTLTNAVGTSRQLSSKERAILAFQGKLNR